MVTVAARGSGDDEIVAQVVAAPHHRCVIVTADRELRARLGSMLCVGPSWLLDLLDQPDGAVTRAASALSPRAQDA